MSGWGRPESVPILYFEVLQSTIIHVHVLLSSTLLNLVQVQLSTDVHVHVLRVASITTA